MSLKLGNCQICLLLSYVYSYTTRYKGTFINNQRSLLARTLSFSYLLTTLNFSLFFSGPQYISAIICNPAVFLEYPILISFKLLRLHPSTWLCFQVTTSEIFSTLLPHLRCFWVFFPYWVVSEPVPDLHFTACFLEPFLLYANKRHKDRIRCARD